MKEKLVEVTWLDSVCAYGWRDRKTLECAPYTIVSVGWLTGESETAIAITQGICESANQLVQTTVIPKVAIVKQRTLEKENDQ